MGLAHMHVLIFLSKSQRTRCVERDEGANFSATLIVEVLSSDMAPGLLVTGLMIF
jgi:hypothetical protein